MMTAHTIGMISLNISFILYLVVFLPQIVHNRHTKHIQHLSLSMHYVLYLGVLLDLFYGFAGGYPWQYKSVSIACLFVLSIQHVQMTRYYWSNHQKKQAKINLFAFFIAIVCIVYFFNHLMQILSEQNTETIGYMSRACNLLYTLPQIIKNKQLKQGRAISLPFILINIVLLTLDTISGWCLDWGWPNKLSAPISLVFMLILLRQKLDKQKISLMLIPLRD